MCCKRCDVFLFNHTSQLVCWVREQATGRTLFCLQRCSHTFSTIYAIRSCPSIEAGSCKHVYRKLGDLSALSLISRSSPTNTYCSCWYIQEATCFRTKRVQGLTCQHIHMFFPPMCVWVSDWPADTPTQTYTFQLLLFCPSYSIPNSERVNEQVQGCNCYHLEKER